VNDPEISLDEFKSLLADLGSLLILDVREPWEYKIAHIPGSLLLSQENFKETLEKARFVTHVVVVCHHGFRSLQATQHLHEEGLTHVRSLQGGIDAYSLFLDPLIPRY
jgi:rhodanese-related sulfurtransferase